MAEQVGVLDGAARVGADLRHAEAGQPSGQPGAQVEARGARAGGRRAARQCGLHLVAHRGRNLVALPADGGAEQHLQPFGGGAERSHLADDGVQDPGGGADATRVCRPDDTGLRIAQQHRDAVRGEHGDAEQRHVGDDGVDVRDVRCHTAGPRPGPWRLTQDGHVAPVHLSQEHQPGQAQLADHPGPVRRHGRRVVADAEGQVERGERAARPAARTRRRDPADARPGPGRYLRHRGQRRMKGGTSTSSSAGSASAGGRAAVPCGAGAETGPVASAPGAACSFRRSGWRGAGAVGCAGGSTPVRSADTDAGRCGAVRSAACPWAPAGGAAGVVGVTGEVGDVCWVAGACGAAGWVAAGSAGFWVPWRKTAGSSFLCVGVPPSNPAAITVTRTSSPRESSITVPKMMFASGCAASWTSDAASWISNSPRSEPPAIESSTPCAPSIDASSSGELMAFSAACTARPSPREDPMPISAEPAPDITDLTSAKSRLIRPGVVIRLVMPWTPESSTSSAERKASISETPTSPSCSSRSFGMTISVSHSLRSPWMPSSAWPARRRPSNVKGRVTTPMVSAPSFRAIDATTGAPPVPVPPPSPAVTKTMSAPLRTSSISSAWSSAALPPTSGLAPAPRPRVSSRPMSSLTSASDISSAWASVFTAMNSTPLRPTSIMRLTAFTPPPPMPTTLITAR
ncbi:hypothetical protein Ae168Ps1_5723 [Pseudonocardia sp. Ae168_Ps1]|nr:hypothetical protein Ae168Ps1_5723 [Pseudonocardia sp. Ae168_Ps1]